MKIVKTNIGVLVGLLGIFVATLTMVVFYLFGPLKPALETDDVVVSEPGEPEVIEPANVEPTLPERIDFQPIIDEWVNGTGGNKSVVVYDLDRNEVVGSYNSSESYNTASLYKLFVVYEGYRRVQTGEWNGNDIAGSTGHTILECLDLAIRESNSACAETLWGYIGRAELDAIIADTYSITNSDISHLISNPEDIVKMLQIYDKHKDITDEALLTQIWDSFLNQPITTYDWRQGLPSGFSTATVYNKVGWDFNPDGGYWNLYHDAAIVEFPETVDESGEIIVPKRRFIVVVMTNYVAFQRIREFGRMFESGVIK